MKSTQAFLAIGILTGAFAAPTQEIRDDAQTAHLKFNGESDSYTLNVKADGKTVKTEKDIAIKFIDANDYNANAQCTFKTTGDKVVETELKTNPEDGTQKLVVEDAKPIVSVACEGMCIPTYGSCYDNNNQPLGPCCNGFCAATKCRPWNTGN